MAPPDNSRLEREREHGRHLIDAGAESSWGWTTPAGRRRAARRGARIAAAARLGSRTSVLELGCGTGIFTEAFARTGARILAVDVSEELLALARARSLPAGRVTFLCDDFESMRLTQPFDAVIGSSVLHHLQLDRAFSRLFGAVRPGGSIAFAEPNMLNPQVFLERHVRAWFPYVSPDETAFVRWQVGRKLKEAGFVDVVVTPFDWLHPRTWPPLIRAVESAGAVLERTPLLREFAGSLLITGRRG